MILIHTAAGRFSFSAAEHTYTAHADGDLTIEHHQRGMVAVFARGQWTAVVSTPAEATR